MVRRFLEHLGRYSLMLKGSIARPENTRVYWKEFMDQCNDIGIRSLPIVLIISLFLGMVLTVQTAYQLVSPLVPKPVVASIVRDSMILELSPTVICVVLAGVIGSKIASELGNMRVSEQIDALEIMGINTKTYLVLPKIVASLVMIPCLIIISIAIGIWGGYLAGMFSSILTKEQFEQGLVDGFLPYNLFFAMTKAFTFAFNHFHGARVLRILCAGRRAGNRPCIYHGGGGELHPDSVRRLRAVDIAAVEYANCYPRGVPPERCASNDGCCYPRGVPSGTRCPRLTVVSTHEAFLRNALSQVDGRFYPRGVPPERCASNDGCCYPRGVPPERCPSNDGRFYPRGVPSGTRCPRLTVVATHEAFLRNAVLRMTAAATHEAFLRNALAQVDGRFHPRGLPPAWKRLRGPSNVPDAHPVSRRSCDRGDA